MYQAFGFVINHRNEALANSKHISEIFCVFGVFDPADLIPDAFHRIEIASFFVESNIHIGGIGH